MDKNTFENTIYQNWTSYFGVPLETVHRSGTTLLPENKYDGERIIALWHIGKHTFAQLDPAYHLQLKDLIKKLPAGTSLSGDQIQEGLGHDAVLARDIGLTYYLNPEDLPAFIPPEPFVLRQLTEADEGFMADLKAANTPEDVDEAYVEVTHQIAFGCFHGEQLTAAASGYERTGFLDLGVLTHPQFRKKGLGKAVTGALCNWADGNNLIAQYRHNVLNINSQRVAESLNFQMYFKNEGISLR